MTFDHKNTFDYLFVGSRISSLRQWITSIATDGYDVQEMLTKIADIEKYLNEYYDACREKEREKQFSALSQLLGG